jgi:signal transduction histidine kinase
MNSDNHPDKSTHMILNNLKDIAVSVMYAAEGRTLEKVLERIAQASRELVQARYAALGVPDGSGGLRYFKVAGMSPEAVKRMGHLPTGRGLLGAIMTERKPIRLADMRNDSRSQGFCEGHPPMTSLLGVPIIVGPRLLGMLYLCDRLDGQPFDEQDEWLVETMAGYAALAIAGADWNEQQTRLTLLEERERIGMELHDGVIQSLYAIGMYLDLLRTDDEIKPEALSVAINDLNSVIEDIRRYILNLNSRRNATIYICLREMLDRLRIPNSIKVEIEAPDDQPPFATTTFDALCQIANEAISNAIRHANASRILIRVEQANNEFRIIIADDGEGFDLDTVRQNQTGLGLVNIEQRARLYNGRVQISTEPGRGTTLTIALPLR